MPRSWKAFTENFNTRIKQDIFYLPNPARRREFKTATGKANFYVHPLPQHHLEAGQLMLMTVRSHDQFNTTIYGLDDRYRGIHGGRRVIFVNRDDLAELGIPKNAKVDITSHFEGEQHTAKAFQVVVRHSPPLRRCLLPRSQRAGADWQQSGEEQFASLQVCHHQFEGICVVKIERRLAG